MHHQGLVFSWLFSCEGVQTFLNDSLKISELTLENSLPIAKCLQPSFILLFYLFSIGNVQNLSFLGEIA